MEPSIGRIVHYRLSHADVSSLYQLQAMRPVGIGGVTGLPHQAGDTVPVIITAVNGDLIMGQAFLVNNVGTLLVAYVHEGTEYGQWSWPPRN